MITINGCTVKQLSQQYNIPIKTIYTWNSRDPENVFDRIVKRRIADINLAKKRNAEELRKQAEESNKRIKKEDSYFRLANIMVVLALILILSFLTISCSPTVERFELPPEKNYTYYETASADVFMEMVLEKSKDNSLVYDPSICLKDKLKLPRKEHILEDMNKLEADSVIVVNLNNSNGQISQVNGKWEFGYKSGYYCKSAAFFKKKDE